MRCLGMDPAFLFASLIVGTVGLGMLTFGKKAGRIVPLVCGLALMVVSYVMPTATSMLLTSGVVVAVPFVVKS